VAGGILAPGDRAMWGASGALYPQPALAGPMLARGTHGPDTLRARSDEGRVPRDANLRTPSGPEGSSGKRALAGAAGTPGRSRRPVEAAESCVVNGECTVTISVAFGRAGPGGRVIRCE